MASDLRIESETKRIIIATRLIIIADGKSLADYDRRRYDNFGRGGEYNPAIKRFAPRATHGPPRTEKYKYTIKRVSRPASSKSSVCSSRQAPRLALISLGTRRRDVARRDERRTARIPLTRSRSLQRPLHLKRNKGRRERERRTGKWGGIGPYPSRLNAACRTFRVTFRTSPSVPFPFPVCFSLAFPSLLLPLLFTTVSFPICQFSALLTFPLFCHSPK